MTELIICQNFPTIEIYFIKGRTEIETQFLIVLKTIAASRDSAKI